MFRKWIKCGILLFGVILFLISCRSGKQTDQDGCFAQEYVGYADGFVLNVVNGSNLTEDGVIYLERTSDGLTVQFANLTKENSEFVLKLFLDYSEVDFLIGEAIYSSYEFKLDANEYVQIQLSLESTIDLESSHMLTVGVFTAPNKHASEIELMSNSYGMVLTYEIVSRNGLRTYIEDIYYEKPEKYLMSEFQGIMLNEDFLDEDNNAVKFPPLEVKASPGEEITFAYRLGNYDNEGDVMLIVLVDWTQIELNGSNYLLIENRPGFVGFGEIGITAPLDKGKYEVTAFAVDQPFSMRDATNFFTHDTAYRFTLTVQ